MTQRLGDISQHEQEKRKKFLFRFLKENGIFTVMKKRFDKNFARIYITTPLITNYDDFVNFFVKSKQFSKFIVYAFDWRFCGWPNGNESLCYDFWRAISDKFEINAKMFDKY